MSPGGTIDEAALAALAWQIELGADEAICETPQDRFAESAPKSAAAPTRDVAEPIRTFAPPPPRGGRDGEGVSTPAAGASSPEPTRPLAEAARTLDDLAAAMRAWDGSPLKATARNFVFSDGLPGARLMVVGEAPGQEEDRQGKPFVGRAGQLLDRMLAAIGLARTSEDPATSVYIANMLPWRPPGNRTPSEAEALAFLPFVEQHIRLANPDIVLTMGNTPTKALLATATGIRRMRGTWTRHGATGKPMLATFHPAYLLRQPAEKRGAWLDLVALRKALDEGAPV